MLFLKEKFLCTILADEADYGSGTGHHEQARNHQAERVCVTASVALICIFARDRCLQRMQKQSEVVEVKLYSTSQLKFLSIFTVVQLLFWQFCCRRSSFIIDH